MIHLLIILTLLRPPDGNYKKIFGEHYTNAEEYLHTISPLSDSIFALYRQDKETLESVVFPELLRYSIIRDYLETSSLEIVYVNTGLADFSIGRFQIKPSFAEKIEIYFLNDSSRLWGFSRDFFYNSIDPVEIRRERVDRLKSISFQLKYLAAFSLIMEAKYPSLAKKNKEYKIRFLSTAYNHNFESEKETIEQYMYKKFFPWGIKPGNVKYNYSDISWFYYRKLK